MLIICNGRASYSWGIKVDRGRVQGVGIMEKTVVLIIFSFRNNDRRDGGGFAAKGYMKYMCFCHIIDSISSGGGTLAFVITKSAKLAVFRNIQTRLMPAIYFPFFGLLCYSTVAALLSFFGRPRARELWRMFMRSFPKNFTSFQAANSRPTNSNLPPHNA